MARKDYDFTDTQWDVPIGTRAFESAQQIGRSVEAAWRDNMDTFSGPGASEVTRVTESDTGKVVGWVNNHSGKYIPR